MSEQQVFTKCAWRLIPFMALLFVVNYVDRANVGFAALTMNEDLDFSPAVYGFGAGIFFLTYVLFQVPANLILERIGARRWIFCILAVWGLISAANALVQGPVSFYILRLLLGVAEAGFFPGMLLYLTYWFPQAYLARYISCFMISMPLSFVVGGPLASLILEMDGVGGLHGWQWLFLLEGIPSALLSFVVLKVLPDGPADAPWLSGEEKKFIAARIAADNRTGQRTFWFSLRDPRVYVFGIALSGILIAFYGIGLWLPQIVQAMGFSNRTTGYIVALPYAASVGAMIFWARSSDKRGERVWHVVLAVLAAAAGFAVASFAQSNLLMLLALTLTAAGVLSALSPLGSLLKSTLSGPASASGIALYNSIGNLGGFLGPYIIGALKESTGDYSASMAAIAVGLVLSALTVLALGRAMAPLPAMGV